MMKIYNLILFFIIATSLFGCQDDDVFIQDTPQAQNEAKYSVEVIDNMLYFNSREDYENTIDYLAQLGDENFVNWENEIAFNSMRANFNEKTLEEMGIEDSMLATLLNPESQIRIGDNIFEIDMKTETVKMTPAFMYSKRKSFSEQDGYREFSTEDEVLDILDGIETDLIAKRKKRFCRTGKLSGSWREPNSGTNIDYKVVYQKSGIFKSLQAKIKRQGSVNGLELVLKTSGSDNFWRSKRGGKHYFSTTRGGTGRVYNYRPYNRTRRLKDFKYSVEFEALNESGWGAGIILNLRCRR